MISVGGKMIIFSPGPANISERVRTSLLLPDICHRSKEFTDILQECRQNLLKVCKAKGGYKSIILTGSGTAGIESVIGSLGNVIRRLLIIVNGDYGLRAVEVANTYGVLIKKMVYPANYQPRLEKVREALKGVDAVYLVHHETTLGLLNPLKEIAQLAKEAGKWVIVDGVSSIGGEELQLDEWGVDAIIGSANKCIRGIPGLAFIVAHYRFLGDLGSRERKTYYTDLVTHLLREEKGETPFTPAVQTFFAFREALRELLEEGVDNRITHYKLIAERLRWGLKRRGYTFVLPEEIMSNTMTTVYLPTGVTFESLYKRCKEKGFEIYRCTGELKDKAFRLGTVGVITLGDIERFLEVI